MHVCIPKSWMKRFLLSFCVCFGQKQNRCKWTGFAIWEILTRSILHWGNDLPRVSTNSVTLCCCSGTVYMTVREIHSATAESNIIGSSSVQPSNNTYTINCFNFMSEKKGKYYGSVLHSQFPFTVLQNYNTFSFETLITPFGAWSNCSDSEAGKKLPGAVWLPCQQTLVFGLRC